MNPYVFFVGCPRSGTTLLARIGDAHPELAIVYQTRWIARTYEERRRLTPEGLVTPKLIERMRDPRRLSRLTMEEDDLEKVFPNGADVHFSTFVTALFDLCSERQGKPLVGDKSPGYVRYLPLLHELWPQAKFVHILRDGRDVSLSVRDWGKGATRFSTFRDDPVTTTAVWWEWYVRLGLEGATRIGTELYHELRYESLVAEPERECVRLCEFLEIGYDEAMLRFHEGRFEDDPRLDAKKAWRPVTAGLRSWRTQMPPADVVRFEAAAGDLLEALGYERTASSSTAKERDRAEQIRGAFVAELRAQRRPLPVAWSNGAAAEVPASPLGA